MTGNQVAKQLKGITGKVYAFVTTRDDGHYLPVEKAALMEFLVRCDNTETGMKLRQVEGRWFFERDYDSIA